MLSFPARKYVFKKKCADLYSFYEISKSLFNFYFHFNCLFDLCLQNKKFLTCRKKLSNKIYSILLGCIFDMLYNIFSGEIIKYFQQL